AFADAAAVVLNRLESEGPSRAGASARRVRALRNSRPRPRRYLFDVARRSMAARCRCDALSAESAASLLDAGRWRDADDHGGAGHRPRAVSRVRSGTPRDRSGWPELALFRRAASRDRLFL